MCFVLRMNIDAVPSLFQSNGNQDLKANGEGHPLKATYTSPPGDEERESQSSSASTRSLRQRRVSFMGPRRMEKLCHCTEFYCLLGLFGLRLCRAD